MTDENNRLCVRYAILILIICLPLQGNCTETLSQHESFIGQWVGEAHSSTENTRLIVSITQANGKLKAELSLPDVGVSGWPAHSVTATSKELAIKIPSDSGMQTITLSIEKNRLRGEWREPRYETPATIQLELSPDLQEVSEERVEIAGAEGALGASLILPAKKGPYPGIVFLHGSGPQPRDASRFAAETLARQGIASLIFDKRGVAESEGELSGVTFEDLAADGIATAKYLLQRPEISHVGFFGHSQGGWIGPLAGSAWAPTAFVISSAGPAVPPSREAQWDVVRNVRALGATEITEQALRDAIELWHKGVRTDDWALFDSAVSRMKAKSGYLNTGLEWYEDHPDEIFKKSYRAFMDYDPIPALQALDAPLLALLTPDDESIDSVETEIILRDLIAKGLDASIKLYPGYNHSFRQIGTGNAPKRWPAHPVDYFLLQSQFILKVTGYTK